MRSFSGCFDFFVHPPLSLYISSPIYLPRYPTNKEAQRIVPIQKIGSYNHVPKSASQPIIARAISTRVNPSAWTDASPRCSRSISRSARGCRRPATPREEGLEGWGLACRWMATMGLTCPFPFQLGRRGMLDGIASLTTTNHLRSNLIQLEAAVMQSES